MRRQSQTRPAARAVAQSGFDLVFGMGRGSDEPASPKQRELSRLETLAKLVRLGRAGDLECLLGEALERPPGAFQTAAQAAFAVALADHRQDEAVAWLPTAFERVAVRVPDDADMSHYEAAVRLSLPDAVWAACLEDPQATTVDYIWRLARARCAGDLLARIATRRSGPHMPVREGWDAADISTAEELLGTLFTLHLASNAPDALDPAMCAGAVGMELERRARESADLPF